MLMQAAAYAIEHGIAAEPGFTTKTVKWGIRFSESGEFLDVIRLSDSADAKDPGRTFGSCPDLQQNELVGGSETKCHFLVETAQVVALLFANDADREAQEDKALAKHEYLVRTMEQAATAVPDLAPIAEALADESVLEKIRAAMTGVKPADKVTFVIGLRFLLDSTEWHDWWREYRVALKPEKPGGAPRMRSLVTGALAPSLATHPTVTGLSGVGGQPTGDRLICFDKEAFRSFGLEQSSNCAVEEASASAYRAALNALIAESGKPIAGAKIVHWYSRPLPSEDDWLAFVETPSREQEEAPAAERARELLDSIRSGSRPQLGEIIYYTATLSGAAGRVMVRDWAEGRFEDLVESVGRWFADLEITSLRGDRLARDPGIERVIASLLLPRAPKQSYTDWMKPAQSLAMPLWRCALQSARPIPFGAMAKVTLLNTRFTQSDKLDRALSDETPANERAALLSLFQNRMKVMKAYHIRKGGGGSELSAYLNEDHPSPAYQCGRTMAVLRSIQIAAQREVGADIVQRFYAAASATPGLVLSRLIRLSNFHLAKIEPRYVAKALQDRLASAFAKIGDSVPRTLTLEEQSLFALGYYQQIAQDNADRAERRAEKAADGDNSTEIDDETEEDTQDE